MHPVIPRFVPRFVRFGFIVVGALSVLGACGDDQGGNSTPDARLRMDASRADAGVDGAIDGPIDAPIDAAIDAAENPTNLLVMASGSGAPLMDGLPPGNGVDFVLDAILGEGRVRIQNGTTRSWSCSAPGGRFTTYDLVSGETGRYYFKLSGRPQDWTPGMKPIDGTNISVYVGNDGPGDMPDANTVRGTAVSGMVNLIKTPTEPCTLAGCTPEQQCAFSIENVDLVFSNGT